MPSSVNYEVIAQTVLNVFDRHYSIFLEITHGAKQRFIEEDWKADRVASRQRITLYQQRVDEACEQIRENFDLSGVDQAFWKKVKQVYVSLLYEHRQPELAETFYNSVFTRTLDSSLL